MSWCRQKEVGHLKVDLGPSLGQSCHYPKREWAAPKRHDPEKDIGILVPSCLFDSWML